MAGILNSKQRIMDVIITENGRRQIADGTFDIRYASFSDYGVFYNDDGTGVTDNAEDRIMFEANTSNSDIIIPEINDNNGISIDTSAGNKITNSRFYTSGSYATNTSIYRTGSVDVFSSSAEVIKTAIDNFDNLQIIGTDNGFYSENLFDISTSKITFNNPGNKEKSVDVIPPTYADESLASNISFKYMAPIVDLNGLNIPMGTYPKFQNGFHSTIDTLKDDLYKDSQHQTFEINSSKSVDLLCQLFEVDDKKISKLAIVDYASYYDSSGKFVGQVYHLGKLYKDKNNIPKFVKIMCILFE